MSVIIGPQIPAKLVATVPPSKGQNEGDLMTRILLLGLDPETVDYSDPALPPGMNAEKVRTGIAVATVERQLRSTNYDCVVIGGGVRLPPRNLALFEVVINAVRKAAPGAAIAFNTRPDDSAMLPPDRWRLEAELYSPASSKTSSPPQARRAPRLSDSPLTRNRL